MDHKDTAIGWSNSCSYLSDRELYVVGHQSRDISLFLVIVFFVPATHGCQGHIALGVQGRDERTSASDSNTAGSISTVIHELILERQLHRFVNHCIVLSHCTGYLTAIMGGKVFDHLGLKVPRMPPEVYQRMITIIRPKLEQFFDRVAVPRDAPGKTDHGDIDFLVDGIRTQAQDGSLWQLVQGALGADHHKGQGSHSYAIPHPDIDGAHVQVDVELNPGDFDWTLFMKGDGDLLQILGIAHRPLGLTCTDQGLHVRLEEIETYDKKEARVFLTDEPAQAMRFYGLDVDKYKEGFSNETELFDWVAAGRFFSREVFERRVEKADDRTRQLKRPLYRHFVEDYMPTVTHSSNKIWTRAEVLHEALATFEVRAEYDKKMAKHDLSQAEKQVWEDVKARINASEKSMKMAVRALRRWIGFERGEPVVLQQPLLPQQYLNWAMHIDRDTKQGVLDWVERNWQHVKSRDKAYQNVASVCLPSGIGNKE